METLHFRILFWQKFVPLFALPVLAMFIVASPVTDGWSRTMWIVAGGLVGAAIARYLWRVWQTSDVRLDATGLTLYGSSGRQTWPYEKLLKVKQVGKYRVRMCFDPDIPDNHMHITIDLFDSDGFVDALLDRYEDAQGHELPELESHDAAA
jgi:hypothetical protein